MEGQAFKILIDDFIKGLDRVVEYDKQTVTDQGHVATGKMRDSISKRFKVEGDYIIGFNEVIDYGVDVSTGLKPSEVNYTPDEIEDWAKIVKPDLSDSEIARFAINTWKKHNKYGIPLESSKAFSKTGKRTDWIPIGDKYVEDNFDTLFPVERFLDRLLTESMEILKETAIA